MNQKEKKREQQELEQAVRVLRATLRSMARLISDLKAVKQGREVDYSK